MTASRHYVLLAICLALWFSILQALYYPFLSPPGTETEWWQIGPMAGIGFVLGLPVFWLWETLAKDRQYSELSFWLLSGVYVLLIYSLLAIASEKLAALRHKHRDT